MYLFILSILGILAPNGIYFYWLVTRFNSIGAALNSELAVGFFIELLIVTAAVAYRFSSSPLGSVRVRWFVVLSAVGGVGFAIPVFYWLNKRAERKRPRSSGRTARAV